MTDFSDDKRGEHQSVRNQQPPDKGKGPWQIVDRVERSDIYDQIKAVVGKGQSVIIANDPAERLRQASAGISEYDSHAARLELGSNMGCRQADNQGPLECALDDVQAFQNFLNHELREKIRTFTPPVGAIADYASSSTIKNFRNIDCIGHRALRL